MARPGRCGRATGRCSSRCRPDHRRRPWRSSARGVLATARRRPTPTSTLNDVSPLFILVVLTLIQIPLVTALVRARRRAHGRRRDGQRRRARCGPAPPCSRARWRRSCWPASRSSAARCRSILPGIFLRGAAGVRRPGRGHRARRRRARVRVSMRSRRAVLERARHPACSGPFGRAVRRDGRQAPFSPSAAPSSWPRRRSIEAAVTRSRRLADARLLRPAARGARRSRGRRSPSADARDVAGRAAAAGACATLPAWPHPTPP